MMRVAVIGATGYTGLEVVRMLQRHPVAQVTMVTSEAQAGIELAEAYPHLQGVIRLPLEQADPARVAEVADVAMVALPSGLSTQLVPGLLAAGVRVIDLAGDHRLPAEVYAAWYGKTPPQEEVLAEAVYGLTEWQADEVRGARLVANPGCYPTATLLALLPLVQQGLVALDSLVVDAKSGVSGAGKGLSAATHFAEVNENLKAYKVGTHQHVPEIEQALSEVSPAGPVMISLTTHLVPMTRGIMATCYATLTEAWTTEALLAQYADVYAESPFVRIRPAGQVPQTKDVVGSNFCDIGLRVDPRTQRVTVVSVIDNLIKGASGQAIQNLNVMAGLEQTTGLWVAPHFL